MTHNKTINCTGAGKLTTENTHKTPVKTQTCNKHNRVKKNTQKHTGKPKLTGSRSLLRTVHLSEKLKLTGSRSLLRTVHLSEKLKLTAPRSLLRTVHLSKKPKLTGPRSLLRTVHLSVLMTRAQLQYTIQYRATISPLVLQTITTAQVLSVGRQHTVYTETT